MTRNLLQDMVKVKNSKPLPIKEIKRPARNAFSIADAGGEEEKIPSRIKQNNKGSKYRIYLVALVAIVFLLFALSFLFSGAKITVVPKVSEIPLNSENLSATKDSNTPDLSFDLVMIPGEETKTIQGGEVKDVAIAATGTILIYNAYNSSPQPLDINTRLEGSNGKIYKTIKKIIVPGITSAGKPGSVEVGIYGAGTGASYNSVPLDFKIFGFKGTAKYSKFYGRSEGDIIGGFSGKSPVVSSLDKTTAVSELKAALQAKLSKKVADQIPSGFILFKNAVFTSILDKDISFTPDKDNTVLVDVKGTLYGFIFDEKKLTAKLAQDLIDKYDGSEVYIPNIKDLTFSLANKDNVSFADVTSINFSLSGTPQIVWKVDKIKLIADVLGKSKNDFNQVLAQYPSIDTAQLVIRPFWKSSFPDKSSSIQVIVNYPK
jgi:hypothetical protein